MSCTVLVGLQWGDEGKAKILDTLVNKADVVVRFQGGANAGHTVVANGIKYAFHQIPSGILHEEKMNVFANGGVIDPIGLVEEINAMKEKGVLITPENLMLSDRAHTVMPYHKVLDGLNEKALGDKKVGTTLRGIGPAYSDKMSRIGIRLGQLSDEKLLKEAIANRLVDINRRLAEAGDAPLSVEGILEQMRPALKIIIPHIKDTVEYLHNCLAEDKEILFEGAQAAMLDIDFGTYPYLTSSNCTVGAACTGAGIPPQAIEHTYGVLKAYTTRVGEGPFVTEELGETGERLRKNGHEFGTTTGRPRRCGWNDIVVAKYATRLNGINTIALTKLDVLSGESIIKLCTAYDIEGKIYTSVPSSIELLKKATPIYEQMQGWEEDITGIRTIEDLPAAAQAYIDRVEELIGAHIGIVSVGPDREQTIIRK